MAEEEMGALLLRTLLPPAEPLPPTSLPACRRYSWRREML